MSMADDSSSQSSILFQAEDKSVTLLDLPRSIEESQVLSSHLQGARDPQLRRLISAPPPSEPFKLPEPKKRSVHHASSQAGQVAELMTLASAESALEVLAQSYSGSWCLPRIHHEPNFVDSTSDDDVKKHNDTLTNYPRKRKRKPSQPDAPAHEVATLPVQAQPQPFLPEGSHHLQGTIQDRRADFLAAAPPFNLVLLDPPWPNRSALRKRSGPGTYSTAASLASIRALLGSIPVAAKLALDGLVAVWVTNNPQVTGLLTDPHDGVFAEWGVELVGSWTWLKVTSAGEPVFDVGSAWRKPWERLLLARRIGSSWQPSALRDRVIVAAPDAHSRKPSLRGLFEEVLPERYEALEVFARNLTAGWWSWGDQVLMFQGPEHWRIFAEESREVESRSHNIADRRSVKGDK